MPTTTLSKEEANETLKRTKNSAAKFYETFWETEDNGNVEDSSGDDEDDNDDDNNGDDAAIKSVSGSSSLDADGGSCGPGDDAFCVSNILWLPAAAIVAYMSDFFRAVSSPWGFSQGDEELNLLSYWTGTILLSLNFGIFYYLVVHLSWNRGIKSDDWDEYVPHAVPVATASFVGAALFLSIGFWPLWGVLTVPILSTVFMGFIVVVSMVSQLYKWRRFGAEREVEKKLS